MSHSWEHYKLKNILLAGSICDLMSLVCSADSKERYGGVGVDLSVLLITNNVKGAGRAVYSFRF